MKLKAKLFGIPSVTVDGHALLLPYKKADALLYYLLVHGSATRSELTDLLWEGSDAVDARKNLRHAIYSIRKAFGCDPFEEGARSVVQLSGMIETECDVRAFLTDRTPETYGGEFLKDFELRAPAFDEWLTDERLQLHAQYLKHLFAALEEACSAGDWPLAERYGERYLDADPLEESAALHLMRAYRAQKKYRKAISLYQTLSKSLSSEFSIAPMKETTALYYQIMDEWNVSTNRSEQQEDEGFVGKSDVLRRLLALCNGVRTREHSYALVLGEAGVGKTYLIDHLLSRYDFSDWIVFRVSCHPSEMRAALAPWNAVMLQLRLLVEQQNIPLPTSYLESAAGLFPCLTDRSRPNTANLLDEYLNRVDYHAASQGALLTLSALSQHMPILLVIEDIHWMDPESAELLTLISRRLSGADITIICTARTTLPEHVQALREDARRDQLIEEYVIEDFDRAQTRRFIELNLPGGCSEEDAERIYRSTDGNALLLVQLLNSIREGGSLDRVPDGPDNIIRYRLSYLTEDERRVLDALSIFTLTGAPVEILTAILSAEPLELMCLCEQLKRKALLSETDKNGQLCYSFAHERISAIFTETQAESQRRILHLRAARCLEAEGSTMDLNRCQQLVRHYTAGGDRFRAFRYRVLTLTAFGGMCYELLPILTDQSRLDTLDEDGLMEYFEALDRELTGLRAVGFEAHADELDALERDLLYAMARYCIHEGLYDEGITVLERLLDSCERGKDQLMAAKAHLQYVFYGVQIYDLKVMQEHLRLGMQLKEHIESSAEWGSYLRLNGLYYLMLGKHEEARLWLEQSIAAFEALDASMGGQYTINIAGAYNYIGETYRRQGDFQSAYTAFDQAIIYNKSFGYYPGAAIFYTDYGVAAFQDGNRAEARDMFLFAEQLYRASRDYSQKPIALSYLAYFDAEDGNWSAAAGRLKRAIAISEKLRAPWWMGVTLYMSWKIRGLLDAAGADVPELTELWPQSEREHCLLALQSLHRMERGIETDELEQRLLELV